MKILDLRPLWVRLFSRRSAHSTETSAGPLAGIVRSVMNRRVAARPAPPTQPFLISVGNLALGGTGKTPVVMDLARSLGAAGVRGAILTRGYGSPLAGPLVVSPDNTRAGDEARLMASGVAGVAWPVIQSHDRANGWCFLQENFPDLRLVLLEDAHQSAGLPRHLDLVILDSWDVKNFGREARLVPWTGRVFPFGPWREDAEGAERAAALLVESDREDLPRLSVHGQPVFAFQRRQTLRWMQGDEARASGGLRWALLSGIARPEGFERAAAGALPGQVVLSARCRDHSPYGVRMVERILRAADEAGAEAIATTAKDWVKLADLWRDPRPLVVLDLHLVWKQENAPGQWLAERAGLPFQDANQSGFTEP